jgi:hypothetical protein
LPDAQKILVDRVEKQSLYALSHLELQNLNKDLLFSRNGQERLNACLNEFRKTKPHERLFVWEPEVSEKKKESNQSALILLALVAMLILANYFR